MSHDPKISNHSSFFGDNFTTPEQDHGASLEELEPIVRMAYSASAEVILCVTCVIPSSVDQGGWSEDEIRVFGDRCTVAFLSVEMQRKWSNRKKFANPGTGHQTRVFRLQTATPGRQSSERTRSNSNWPQVATRTPS